MRLTLSLVNTIPLLQRADLLKRLHWKRAGAESSERSNGEQLPATAWLERSGARLHRAPVAGQLIAAAAGQVSPRTLGTVATRSDCTY